MSTARVPSRNFRSRAELWVKTRRARILNPISLGLGVAFLGAIAVGLRLVPTREPPFYWAAPDFALVNQDGDTIRAAHLKGTPWVASFVFTNCTSVCPLITQKMANLRDTLRREELLGEKVRLISFSVDPGRDTPEVLREYASRFGGSPADEWAFLTGSPPGAVLNLIQNGFKLTASAPPAHEHGQDEYQVMHSPRVLLMDAAGQVRGLYDSTDVDAMQRLQADLRTLIRS